MALEIYLIRHAETEVNTVLKDIIGGRSNWAELTENGIAQAIALGRRLRDEGVTFDAVHSSPAIRAQQTAHYFLEAMGQSIWGVELEQSIIELSQGDWEGKQRKGIYSRQDVREGLDRDSWNYVPGDVVKGESHAAVAQRMRGWLEQTVEKYAPGRVAAVTHALSIKYLLADLFDLDRKTAYKIPVSNASITVISYEDGKPICTKRNDVSHLDSAGLSTVKGPFEDPNMNTA